MDLPVQQATEGRRSQIVARVLRNYDFGLYRPFQEQMLCQDTRRIYEYGQHEAHAIDEPEIAIWCLFYEALNHVKDRRINAVAC